MPERLIVWIAAFSPVLPTDTYVNGAPTRGGLVGAWLWPSLNMMIDPPGRPSRIELASEMPSAKSPAEPDGCARSSAARSSAGSPVGAASSVAWSPSRMTAICWPGASWPASDRARSTAAPNRLVSLLHSFDYATR